MTEPKTRVEKEMKEIAESDEYRLYRLRKQTRAWRGVSNWWILMISIMAAGSIGIPIATAFIAHEYPPDSTDHYIKTGELNKTAASLIDRIVSAQTDGWAVFIAGGFLLGAGLTVVAVILYQVRPSKEDIAIFDEALELYATGKVKDHSPKFCPECGLRLPKVEDKK